MVSTKGSLKHCENKTRTVLVLIWCCNFVYFIRQKKQYLKLSQSFVCLKALFAEHFDNPVRIFVSYIETFKSFDAHLCKVNNIEDWK